MEEHRSYSVLNYVRSQKTSDLCRFLFCATTVTSSDQVLKFFTQWTKENSSDSVTGLLLIYPHCIVHLLESSEDEIFQTCSYLVNAEPKCLGTSKCFPMQLKVNERFFDKWRARKVACDCDAVIINEEELVDDFDNVKEMYRQLIDNLYSFCNELRASRMTSRACLIDKLDALASEGDPRLPEVRTLGSILQSSWGESLENLMEDYSRGISSTEVEEIIWPFPTNHCPPMDTIK